MSIFNQYINGHVVLNFVTVNGIGLTETTDGAQREARVVQPFVLQVIVPRGGKASAA